MTFSKKYLSSLVAGVLLIGLSSCSSLTSDRRNSSPTPSENNSTPTPVQPRQNPPTPRATPFDSAGNANTVAVTVYKPDNQCETLVPEKVAVSQSQPIESAVGKVLEQQDTADFDLAGYRVNLDPTRQVATVDLRLSPDSKRQFVSLSSCEQFALFGSLRKTLTENTQWKIKDVMFTQQGEEIIF